ncbi:threonine synthase [Humibacter ginsengiterrae]
MTDGDSEGMWRYFDRLPLRSRAHIVSLGEGGTPLVDLSPTIGRRLGLGRLWLKAEDRNPTGSFKARIASVAYSLVRERNLHGAVGTSSGNGGAAAAAYAAAAGSRAVLFTLSDTVPEKMREIIAVGGIARRVSGVGHDASTTRAVADEIAHQAATLGFYPMLTGFHYAPEAMRGVQTIAYELSERLGNIGRVYAPVGGGGLLTGLHRGFTDLGSVPRLIGVHPTGSAALTCALRGHPEGISGEVTTSVSGLQMAVLYDTDGAVRAVRGSRGAARAVEDDEVYAAQRLLATEAGILVEPAGATALAGVIADVGVGAVDSDEPVVVIATGAGYKDGRALADLAGHVTVPEIAAAGVAETLGSVVEDCL